MSIFTKGLEAATKDVSVSDSIVSFKCSFACFGIVFLQEF